MLSLKYNFYNCIIHHMNGNCDVCRATAHGRKMLWEEVEARRNRSRGKTAYSDIYSDIYIKNRIKRARSGRFVWKSAVLRAEMWLAVEATRNRFMPKQRYHLPEGHRKRWLREPAALQSRVVQRLFESMQLAKQYMWGRGEP